MSWRSGRKTTSTLSATRTRLVIDSPIDSQRPSLSSALLDPTSLASWSAPVLSSTPKKQFSTCTNSESTCQSQQHRQPKPLASSPKVVAGQAVDSGCQRCGTNDNLTKRELTWRLKSLLLTRSWVRWTRVSMAMVKRKVRETELWTP
eukprot:3586819-Rhodomonas_salina.1